MSIRDCCIAFVLALPIIVPVNLMVACSSASAEEAKTAAKCQGARLMFDRAQTELLIARCADAGSVDECPEHEPLREALVATLIELECGTDE